jgi:hypothetical protein
MLVQGSCQYTRYTPHNNLTAFEARFAPVALLGATATLLLSQYIAATTNNALISWLHGSFLQVRVLHCFEQTAAVAPAVRVQLASS